MALWIPFKNYPAKWNAGRLRGLLRTSGLEPAANRAIANTIGAVMADFAVAERENYLALERAVNAAGGRPPATVVVAASNATAVDKDNADYVCDGTADEVEINAAISDLSLSWPGSVLLTEGEFFTSAEVLLLRGELRGNGIRATIISARHTGTVINNTGGNVVRDLFVRKGLSSNAAIGIDTSLGENQYIDRVQVRECNVGIKGPTGNVAVEDANRVLDCVVRNCPTAGLENIPIVSRTTIINSGTSSGGAAIDSVFGFLVANNAIDGASGPTQVGIKAPRKGTTVDNYIKGVGSHGIECGPGSAGVDEAGVVSGNVIDSCTTGIYVDGSRWLLVGNSIFLPGTHGIDLDNSSAVDIMVLNNKIHDPGGDSANTYDGIHIQSADCTVQGNMCRNPSGNGRYGINITGVSSGAYVVNNDLRDAADWGTDALVDSGTGSIITDPGHATYGDNVT